MNVVIGGLLKQAVKMISSCPFPTVAHKCKTNILFRKQKSLFESNTFFPKPKRLIQSHNADKIRECCIKTKFIYQKPILVSVNRNLFVSKQNFLLSESRVESPREHGPNCISWLIWRQLGYFED